jgi:ABC-type dipeptide/oligopeptide/nickel transport system permease component
MREYILKQLMTAVPTLLGVSIAVFLMLHLTPGGAVEAIVLQGGAAISAETMAKMREELGFNDPLYVQYWRFFSKAIRGDFGRSYRTQQPVADMILGALPGTAQLAVAGLAIALVLGLSMGVISALWHNTWIDNACMVVAMLGWSMPQFWLGLVLILLFSVRLGWLPITGQGGVKRLIMPAFTLGLSTAGVTARLVRAGMLEILRMDYVRTARAKGLRESVVVLRHVLRNALIPVVTVVGLQFGRLLGGTVVIETVFARQGVGRVALQALLARDMPTVQGTVLFLAVIYVMVNILVDFSYAFLDPRIRYA